MICWYEQTCSTSLRLVYPYAIPMSAWLDRASYSCLRSINTVRNQHISEDMRFHTLLYIANISFASLEQLPCLSMYWSRNFSKFWDHEVECRLTRPTYTIVGSNVEEIYKNLLWPQICLIHWTTCTTILLRTWITKF